GHFKPIKSLAFSPDGKYVVSGSEDKNIKVWHIKTGKEFRGLRGHKGEVISLAFTPDGKTLISGSDDRNASIIFWDWFSGKKLAEIEDAHSSVSSMAVSHKGDLLATGSYREFRVWNIGTKEMVLDVHGRRKAYDNIPIKHTVESIAFSPDDKFIVTGSADNFVRIWKVSDGSLVREIDLKGTESYASTVAVSKKGDLLYHTGSRGKVVIRNFKSGEIVKEFEGLGSGTPCPALFSPHLDYIFTGCGGRITMQSIKSGKALYNIKDDYYSNQAVAFSKNEHLMAVAGKNGKEENSIRLFNVKTGVRIKVMKGYPGRIQDIAFSPDNLHLLSGNYQRPTRIWELASAFGFKNYLDGSYTNRGDIFSSVLFSKDGQTIYNGIQGRILNWHKDQGKLLFKVFKGGKEPKHLALTPDGKHIIQNTGGKSRVWDASNGELVAELPAGKVMNRSVGVTADGKTIFTAGYKQIRRWDASTFEELEPLPTSYYIYEMAFHPNNQIFAAPESNDFYIRRVDTGEALFHVDGTRETSPLFSEDGQILATAKADTIIFRETENFTITKKIIGHKDQVTDLDFTSDGRILASGCHDGTIKLWDVKTGDLLVTFISLNQEDFIITTPELYYMTSKNGTSGVAFRYKDKVFPFDQFDLQYNRPDKVLEKIGYASPEVINALKRSYQKRLKRLNFNEDAFDKDFHIPTLRLFADHIPSSTHEKHLEFSIEAIDEKYNLDRVQLTVNGIPVLGFNGRDLRKKNVSKIKEKLSVELVRGLNKIQVSVLNEKGVESLRESFEVNYEGDTPPVNLHLITIAASEYKNQQMNLKYATKDAEDVIQVFSSKKEFVNYKYKDNLGFDNLITHKLLNEEVTVSNVKALKEKLLQTNVDDQVYIFLSGHGLLDKHLDYFLATYDVNFANPADKGLPYEELENLLDGIPARHKTIFIDACHSGELDKEAVEVTASTQIEVGKVSFRNASDKTIQYQSNLGLENSFNLSKQLFSDLRRRSGTTVISSAGGVEYALEGEDWQNGVFTYCLLSGLKEGKADLNEDGIILISELQSYLQQAVPELTEGKQRPTSRIENISNDFRVW
ncbi:MAG: caspase family protein, partial [Bacteroidota bacterium]